MVHHRASLPHAAEASRPPEVLEHIPNIDHRHGDGRAVITGIAVYDEFGRETPFLTPAGKITLRISAKAMADVARPNVGFMLRNHLGLDFAGTNSTREGYQLPPMSAGDLVTVDFHIDLPELYPSAFSFSPAIADGTLHSYTMCDWIDNAITLQMGQGEGQVYGYLHLPCRVEVNAQASGLQGLLRMSIEFTGERVVPGHVDVDLWNEHFARYAFAARYCKAARVLDAGCGTGYGAHAIAANALSLTGIDQAHDALAYARKQYVGSLPRWVCASCTRIPFDDRSFDTVLAFEVIEHLQEWPKLISEARRVLKDSGVFVVSTPNKAVYAESRADSARILSTSTNSNSTSFTAALNASFRTLLCLENHAE